MEFPYKVTFDQVRDAFDYNSPKKGEALKALGEGVEFVEKRFYWPEQRTIKSDDPQYNKKKSWGSRVTFIVKYTNKDCDCSFWAIELFAEQKPGCGLRVIDNFSYCCPILYPDFQSTLGETDFTKRREMELQITHEFDSNIIIQPIQIFPEQGLVFDI